MRCTFEIYTKLISRPGIYQNIFFRSKDNISFDVQSKHSYISCRLVTDDLSKENVFYPTRPFFLSIYLEFKYGSASQGTLSRQ
jgi:hypothetical protein